MLLDRTRWGGSMGVAKMHLMVCTGFRGSGKCCAAFIPLLELDV